MSVIWTTTLQGYVALTCSTYPKADYTGGCANPCHASCATCSGTSAAANMCTGCKAFGATVPPSSPGTCVCGTGFVPKTSPTINCEPCTNSCTYCLTGMDTYCWDSNTLGALQFAIAARDSFSLPYTTQIHDLLCYRMNVANTPDCAIPSIVSLIGSIGTQGSYAATKTQCNDMLKAEWAYVDYWFTTLFPNFATPLTASPEDSTKVKTILQMWILQFGSNVMKTDPNWIVLVGVFNRSPIPWDTMLAWTNTSPPQYTIDGSTEVNFPSGLSTWLSAMNNEKTAFNTFTKVCGDSNCGYVHCANARRDFCGGSLV